MTEDLPMHRRLSADEPARVRHEAEQILATLPADPHARRHRREIAEAYSRHRRGLP